jgi:hypothetical protein
MHSALVNHVLPTFNDLKLEDITVPSIESWMDALLDSGLSPKRVNNITSCMRVMLKEAKRQGLLQRDPFDVVRPFADNCRERGGRGDHLRHRRGGRLPRRHAADLVDTTFQVRLGL